MATPQQLQYQYLVIQNETEQAASQAKALVPQVTAKDAAAAQTLVDAATAVAKQAGALAAAVVTTPQPTQPNLRAIKVIPPVTPKTGVPVALGVTFINDGAALPPGSLIGASFAVGGTGVTWASTDIGLAAGATMDLRTDTAKWSGGAWTPTAPGTLTVTANVDDVDRIKESNETDNVVSTSVTVTGSVVVPPTTTRAGKLALFPFQGGQNRPNVDPPCCAYNMPAGDQLDFDPRAVWDGSGMTLNAGQYYGMTINGAGYTSPPQLDNMENHTVNITGNSEQDTFGFPPGGPGAPYYISPLALNAGGAIQNNYGGSGMSILGGVIRRADLDKGSIDHGLALWASWPMLDAARTFVWPSSRVDGGDNPTHYSGWVPYGSLLVIPWGDTLDVSGMNKTSQMIYQALKRFGAIIRDTTGQYPPSFSIEVTCTVGGGYSFDGAQMGQILGRVRRVRNQSPDGTNNNPAMPLGGPGNRRAPYLDVV